MPSSLNLGTRAAASWSTIAGRIRPGASYSDDATRAIAPGVGVNSTPKRHG